jgi:hypothetical protein
MRCAVPQSLGANYDYQAISATLIAAGADLLDEQAGGGAATLWRPARLAVWRSTGRYNAAGS